MQFVFWSGMTYIKTAQGRDDKFDFFDAMSILLDPFGALDGWLSGLDIPGMPKGFTGKLLSNSISTIKNPPKPLFGPGGEYEAWEARENARKAQDEARAALAEKIKNNPSIHIHTPKIEKQIPNFVQLNKIKELMDQPKKEKRVLIRKRDYAILELFYATGIRLSELVGLNIGSVDHSNNLIKVLGKGNKERIIPFGDNAKDAIETYLNSRGSGWSSKPNTPLFTSQNDKRISARTVQQRLRQYLQSILGGKKGASPHTLRHTFGTHLLDNDADIRSIQELLGHSSISSTQIYTKVNPQKIKKIYKKAHPHAS